MSAHKKRETLSLLLIWAIILVVTHHIKLDKIGQIISNSTFDLIQSEFSRSFSDKDMPIVVLDLTKDIPDTSEDPDQACKDIINIIDACKDAKAVALDLEITPIKPSVGKKGPVEQLIDHCIDLRNTDNFFVYLPVPVPRTGAPWLEDFDKDPVRGSLAMQTDYVAEIMSEEGKFREDSTSKKIIYLPLNLAMGGTPLPSLAQALVTGKDSYMVPEILRNSNSGFMTSYITQYRSKETEGWWKHGFCYAVNYAPLEELKKKQIKCKDYMDVHGGFNFLGKTQDKYVIIGRIKEGVNQYEVPGQTNGDVDRVFIDACGAWTLLRAPVYTLTSLGDFFIDVGFLALLGITFALSSHSNVKLIAFLSYALLVALAYYVILVHYYVAWNYLFIFMLGFAIHFIVEVISHISHKKNSTSTK